MYPRVNIDMAKLKHNTAALCNICKPYGISTAAVTKAYCADPRMVETILSEPVGYLADSRLENIARYPKTNHKRILLRAPLPAEAARVVTGCDISLNSEMATLTALDTAAKLARIRHGVVLMIDMGDLREGVYHRDRDGVLATADHIASSQGLEFCGVGVNLTCYGSVVPDADIMNRFAGWAEELEKRLQMKFEIVSGGNSSAIDLTKRCGMPPKVNHLRLGESLIRGVETAYLRPIPELEQDVITLEAGLIEVREKPSYPEGEIGYNAFGEKVQYQDRGNRLRGILAIGRQDTDPDDLCCTDPGVAILGASSDHLIVDLQDSENRYKVGDTLRFTMGYSAILKCFTSAYVHRHYLYQNYT